MHVREIPCRWTVPDCILNGLCPLEDLLLLVREKQQWCVCIGHLHTTQTSKKEAGTTELFTQCSWTLALPLSIVQTMHVCTCNTWPVDEPCICAYLKQYSYTWHFGVSQHYTHSWVQQGQHTATLISSVYTCIFQLLCKTLHFKLDIFYSRLCVWSLVISTDEIHFSCFH